MDSPNPHRQHLSLLLTLIPILLAGSMTSAAQHHKKIMERPSKPLIPSKSPKSRKAIHPTSNRVTSYALHAQQELYNLLSSPSSSPSSSSSSSSHSTSSKITPHTLRLHNTKVKRGVAKAAVAEANRPRKSIFMWPGTGVPGYHIQYHNGTVLTSGINVYLLFYGNWTSDAMDVIVSFIQSISDPSSDTLGPSVRKWWMLTQKYTSSDGTSISPQVVLSKALLPSASYETTLSDGIGPTPNDDIFGLVAASIDAGYFSADPQGVYMVLTSPDIHVGPPRKGFCGAYCGWHSYKPYQGVNLPYLFVGDPSTQCHTCGSPLARANGAPGADSMISSIAHELVESASNPDTVHSSGWWAYDYRGQPQEPADLCNGVYRDDANNILYTNAKASYMFNMFGVNGYKFLVQTIPDLKKQACALQIDT